jgi:DNA-binding transcriptional LysR family regulator
MHAAPRGELRVNAAPTFGILQLAPAIADFTARFPAISVELMLSVRIADLVDEGFDVAVWVGELPDSSLIARQLVPAAWSSAARRAVSTSTASRGRPPI